MNKKLCNTLITLAVFIGIGLLNISCAPTPESIKGQASILGTGNLVFYYIPDYDPRFSPTEVVIVLTNNGSLFQTIQENCDVFQPSDVIVGDYCYVYRTYYHSTGVIIIGLSKTNE